jgi:hypothetical protein
MYLVIHSNRPDCAYHDDGDEEGMNALCVHLLQ